MKKIAKATKKLRPMRTSFEPQVRSRHTTHDAIRGKLGSFPVRSVVRLGSTTETSEIYPRSVQLGRPVVEINPVQGVKNSANKRLMKECFTKADVATAPWYAFKDGDWFKVVGHDAGGLQFDQLPIGYPVVSKHIFGSRGTGNKFHEDEASLKAWMVGKNLNNYILEEYFTGVREYRLHVTHDGCFYTCRKMLKQDTPDAERWYRNDDNSVWIMDTNPNFDRPVNWAAIEAECVKALQAVGLDVAAFDVRVQSTKNGKGTVRENPKFIILESNSAPSFGNITTEKYLAVLPQLLAEKL